ncbi:hypothetical protein M3J09_009217 [Ascochyta lentis]
MQKSSTRIPGLQFSYPRSERYRTIVIVALLNVDSH